MTSMQRNLESVGLVLLRVALGVIFLFAGFMKFRMGIGAFAEKAAATIPPWLPHSLGVGYLHALPFAEVLIGVLLILGLFLRYSAACAALILISISIAVTGFRDPSGGPIHSNIVLLAIALGLVLLGPGDISVDRLICARRRRAAAGS